MRDGAGLVRIGKAPVGALYGGLFPFIVLWVLGTGRFCWLVGGADRLVERLMISLPWTTRLSVDFLRSRVNISV